MNNTPAVRAIIPIILGFVGLIWNPQLYAQVQVRQLEIGGYMVALGMTGEQLTQGIGKAFQYRFNPGINSYVFSQNDAIVARVFLKDGRARSIEKFHTVNSRDDGVNAIEEFLSLRRTTNCTFALARDYSEIKEVKVLRTVLTCGNVDLSTEIYFLREDYQETLYAVSIRQLAK